MNTRRLLGAGAVTAIAGLLLAGAPPTAAQARQADDPAQPYLVTLEAPSLLAVTGQPAPTAAPALEAQQDQTLTDAGVDPDAKVWSYTQVANGYAAMLTSAEAGRVARQPGVREVRRDQFHQLHTDTSPGFLGIDGRHGPWQAGIDGEGVIVGVIDTGIWPEHPSFADDGSYAPPPADWMGGEIACEFGDTAHNPADLPFDCQNKLIGARDMRALYKQSVGPEVYNSARDYNGHGTHTASTAGGNRDVPAAVLGSDLGTISGIAPRARIASYSVCGNLGCLGGDLMAAIDTAVADGVDVINYSIGSDTPSVLGSDAISFLLARAAGVFVATSAGNAGPGAGTVGSPANSPWVNAVAASTHDRTFQGAVELGNGASFAGASITGGTDPLPLVDAADHGNELCDPDVTFSPPVTDAIVLCARGVFARVDKSRTVSEQGGAGMVLFNANDSETEVTDNHFVPSVHLSNTSGLEIRDYIAGAGAAAEARIIGGSAATTQDSVQASFSSRGPNAPAPDVIKPDVSAPGVNVLAGNTLTPNLGAPGQSFYTNSGTSMASPHVAGILALIKQAHPDWSPAMAQSAIMTTARQDGVKEDGTTAADPFDFGSGHLDPGRVDRPGSVFNPGLVYRAGFNEYLGFLCEAGPQVLAPGTCETLEGIGVPTTAENLNYPSIGVSDLTGVAEVRRVITSVAERRVNWIAQVDAPDGYEVRVDPPRVRLDPGESAEVTIEITNVDAPAGAWRFGDLTWIGRGHQVRSPIAVRGVAVAAPGEVAGTGVSGDASFDVRFGYDGDYTAAAHGPVTATGIAGSVDHDPEQSFDPEGQGVTAHTLEVTGAAHLRLAVDTADLEPANPDFDLDIFLFDEAGNQVASSGQPSTAEVIDVALPGDGTYTLYVHGWDVLGGTVDYTLRRFDVPMATDTGALTVTGAPDSATVAGSGTVEVAWSGLDAGTTYLGAVSHVTPDGIATLTLVRIVT